MKESGSEGLEETGRTELTKLTADNELVTSHPVFAIMEYMGKRLTSMTGRCKFKSFGEERSCVTTGGITCIPTS